MFKFIFYSYIFRRTIIATLIFIPIIWIVNISFDFVWRDFAALPLVNLYDAYNPPPSYDNIKKIRMKLLNRNNVLIEANRKFKLLNEDKIYSYDASTQILKPGPNSNEITDKIFLKFEHSIFPDSIYLTITKTTQEDIYWNQIFYSSVQISELNDFKEDTEKFRVKEANLVSNEMLSNNDTLINQSITYFNSNIDKSRISSCGINTEIFKSICEKFALPCKIITLMGGDANDLGYGNEIGYPSHSVCEIYSSRYRKWYVLDPTYGFRLKKVDIPLSAVEISDVVFFNEVNNIVRDSLFFTNRGLVGRDYFKYYENVYFNTDIHLNILLRQILRRFFEKFSYTAYHYTNVLGIKKNGRIYLGAKAFIYFIFLLIYINAIVFILVKRLYKEKANNKNT